MSQISVRLGLMVLVWLAVVPAASYAQASIMGAVRDSSGGVMPGVTVEAASPALIERVRSVVTDASGQFRIIDLRPGLYTVTFTLPGFATVRREGIELTGTFTATVNADLRVGALEETITVTGDAPVVDVRGITREVVLNQDLLDALPSSRTPGFMAEMIPGVTGSRVDSGGLRGIGPATVGDISVHGSRKSDMRTLANGVSLHNMNGGGEHGVPNLAAYQEVAFNTTITSAEQKEGGLIINMIPRSGGNTVSGTLFANFANHSMQGDNFTQDLKNRGLGTPNSLKKTWDINPGIGGPIKQDKLWYFLTIRYFRNVTNAPIFVNKNDGNPNAWTYEPDTSQPATAVADWKDANGRITWQITPKNKLAVAYDRHKACQCPRALSAILSPEAATQGRLDPRWGGTVDWTTVATNRLLFDASLLWRGDRGGRAPERVFTSASGTPFKLNPVLEQSSGLAYRERGNETSTFHSQLFYRASASYVTGAHALKVGMSNGQGYQDAWEYSVGDEMNFRFNNGVPNRLTLRARPYRLVSRMDADLGLFVQDTWAKDRLTLTGGLRYDYFSTSFPEQRIGPTKYTPGRDLVLPAAEGVTGWHDLSPRSGVAYDVFGDGKTALKLSLNKYLAGQALDQFWGEALNPGARLVGSTNRSWNDANRDFVPNCNLLAPAANGECGAMDSPDFGGVRPGTTYDPDTLHGWFKRDFNWHFSAGVQRELVPNVALDLSYARRWFGNFVMTQDRAVSPTDYDAFSVTAPLDPRLPGGGGYVVAGLYDLQPGAFGRSSDNFLTYASKFGKQTEHWNGVDLSINARMPAGAILNGSVSTGRRTTDNCDVVTKIGNPRPQYCHVQQGLQTLFKGFGSYIVPKIDLQLSGTFVSVPGPEILAEYVAPLADVTPSLGRNLSGGARNVTVNLVEPGTMYGDRRYSVDLRIGKILRRGRTRATASLDIYNVLNSSTVLVMNNAFATWQRPQEILNARFAKVGLQLAF